MLNVKMPMWIPVTATPRLLVHGALIALLCFSGNLLANDVTSADVTSAPDETEMQARRLKMIEDCKSNRGIDCESEVDTLLEAEKNATAVVKPPGQIYKPPRPTARPRSR